MCCSESQNWLIIAVLKFTRNPISNVVYLRLVRGIQSTIATTTKLENPLNTAQKMASESSTKQDEEATTEEVPGSIAIYTEKEIKTFNRHVTLSVLSLGHFISFHFCHQRGKMCKLFFFSSKRKTACKFKEKQLVNSVKYHYYP